MTKEQIAALIAAKIAGQGSMVDIGGALPEILTALAENGISTDMTVAEQMQARKNLGLYYEAQEPGEKTVRWTDESQSVTLPGWAKISDDTPAKDDIISFAGETGNYLIFTDQTDGYVVTAEDVATGMEMRIVLNDSDGHEPGIYYSWNGREFSPALVYKVLVDTVHKVPAKYLPEPIAVIWNQIVTEGTKIAEVTIGEETTNVFAPEGGGGIDPVTLLAVPTQSDNVLTNYLSLDDYSRLASAETNVAKMADGTTFIVTVDKRFTGSTTLYFYNRDGIEFIITKAALTGSYIVAPYTLNVVKPVVLSGAPSASMTTQAQLDAIGLTGTVIANARNGYVTGFRYNDGFFPLSLVTVGMYGDITIVFSDTTNKYTVVSGFTGVSVTVTPLS